MKSSISSAESISTYEWISCSVCGTGGIGSNPSAEDAALEAEESKPGERSLAELLHTAPVTGHVVLEGGDPGVSG